MLIIIHAYILMTIHAYMLIVTHAYMIIVTHVYMLIVNPCLFTFTYQPMLINTCLNQN